MLDEYPIDPAFNKDLIFAYQPPPEIDTSKLPRLAKNWLEDLQETICAADSQLSKDIDTFFSKTSGYPHIQLLLKQLELVYHRLKGNLDTELGPLAKDEAHAIISKLTEEIKYCSEGFHNRVNIIVDSFLRPKNLAQLLYTVRKTLVEEVASTLTDEVHAQNRVSIIAANDGLGVKANFSNDKYLGALTPISIRRALQQAFRKKFTPFQLPCLLSIAFMKLIPELESEKSNKSGISLQTREKIYNLITQYVPHSIGKKANWKNFFKIFSDRENLLDVKILNINWENLYRAFYRELQQQGYFHGNPQINTLCDSACYNSILKKSPLHLTSELASKFFKEERYSELLIQLAELNTQFPDYYLKLSKNKIFIKNKNCLELLDYLKQQLRISKAYSEEIMQGFHLIICLDLYPKECIIEKIADSLLVKNQAGFNLLMLATQYNPTLTKDIFKFLEKNEKSIDAALTEKMFLMKNKDNLNALMIAASKPAETIVTILDFLATHIGRFANDALRNLFTQQQKDSYTAVTLTARDRPDRLKKILSFISDYIKIDGETLRKLLFFENSSGACPALMLAVKNQADATFSILDFISKNIEKFDPIILGKIFSAKDQEGFTILMLAARYQPRALQFILAFINEYKDKFSAENLSRFFLEKNPKGYNFLMLAARNQYTAVVTILNFIQKHTEIFPSSFLSQLLMEHDQYGTNAFMIAAQYQPEVVKFILDFIQKQPEFFSSEFLEQLLVTHDRYGTNALMVAAQYQPEVVELLLTFLSNKINSININTIKELVFKKISDKTASFVLGCYGVKKSSLSIAIQFKDYIAVNALLKFIDDHIESLGVKILADLLIEEDTKGNYIFPLACSRYSFIMKTVLNFIAELPSFEELTPVHPLLANFIFEQFARWPIKTDADKKLLSNVILNCAALLLIHFNKDFFAEQSNNLKIITDKLFCCYLNELEDRKSKKIVYTTKFSFFNWRYSTSQKLEAARSLKEVLATQDIDKKPALLKLKAQYPALSESRLGNLFAAYQEIDSLLENEAMHSNKLAMVA